MRVRVKALLALTIILLVVPVASRAFSDYLFSYSQADLGSAVVASCALGNDRVIAFFKNGTAALLERLEVLKTLDLGSAPVACDYSRGKVYVVLKNGKVIILTPNLESKGVLNVALRGEKPKYIAASPNGRYGVLGVEYSYKGHLASRLVFFDLETGERVLVRDVKSNPRLVKLFYFNRAGDILLIQTLDTFCELCEYHDNKMEAYNLSTLELMYSVEVGLSFVGYDETRKIVVLARLLEVKGRYELIVMNMLTGEVKYRHKITRKPAGLFVRGNMAIVVASDGSLVAYNVFTGRKVKEVKIGGAASLCRMGGLILVGTPYKVYVVSPSLSVYFSEKVEYRSVPKPPVIACGNAYGYAFYGKTGIYIKYYTEVLLKVYVEDDSGRPVENANVSVNVDGRIHTSTTDKNGLATITVPLTHHVYIEVSKEGFKDKRAKLVLTRPVEEVKITLSRNPWATTLEVKVTHEGCPIKDAIVDLRDPETGRVVIAETTDMNGICKFEGISPGGYVVEVSANGYRKYSKKISVEEGENHLAVDMKDLAYEVRIEVRGGEETYNVTLSTEEGEHVWFGAVVANTTINLDLLRPGIYKVLVKGMCGSKAETFSLDENMTLTVDMTGEKCPIEAPKETVSIDYILDKVEEGVEYLEPIDVYVGDIALPHFNETGELLDLSAESITYVVGFFYTKCWGCENIIPLLEELDELPGVEAAMVTIYLTDTYEDLAEYVREHDLTLPVYRDTAGLHERLGVSVVPSVAVIRDRRAIALGMGAKAEKISVSWSINIPETEFSLPKPSVKIALFLSIVALITACFLTVKAWSRYEL